ncbi:MAG: DUF29 family protein [Cyanobacteria bacterium P01_H01_bin.153]
MTRPSLKTYLVEIFEREYGNARQLLLDTSDLPADGVPTAPCLALDEALDENWLPYNLNS